MAAAMPTSTAETLRPAVSYFVMSKKMQKLARGQGRNTQRRIYRFPAHAKNPFVSFSHYKISEPSKVWRSIKKVVINN